jgi:glycosyltransferase involved in cell wall biosynthesis
MKIAFTDDVVYAYASGAPSAVGGAERYQWLLARALAATGWSVVVGVREALAAGERCAIDGVQYVGIGRGPVFAVRGHIFSVWYRFLSSERPDWWYWQGADHMWGPAVEIAKLAGVHTIFSAAVDRDVQPHHALFRRPRWWPLYAWGLSRTDKIFVQHGGQLAALAPRWRSKASILPGVVDTMAAVKPQSEREQYVAWVAVLRQPKRPDVLIEIARKLPAMRFVVCGGPTTFASPPGYGERIIEALRAQPNIEFLGQVSPQKALQIIADAAILLSTSDEEGFPSTFLEAWSGGTPVISLKLDLDRIIEREGLGTVPGTVERATADLLALMESPQRRDAIAARARQYILDTHSAAAVTTVFEKATVGVLS